MEMPRESRRSSRLRNARRDLRDLRPLPCLARDSGNQVTKPRWPSEPAVAQDRHGQGLPCAFCTSRADVEYSSDEHRHAIVHEVIVCRRCLLVVETILSPIETGEPEIEWPEGYFERREAETPDKGWLEIGVRLPNGSRCRLCFYDLVRASQALVDARANARPFFAERGLIFVDEVNSAVVRRTVTALFQEGFFAS